MEAEFSIWPQLGLGGGTPSPRKLRAASAKIAPPRLALATTIAGAMHCGVTCRSMTRNWDAPMARDASTYGISLTDSTTDRMTLVEPANSADANGDDDSEYATAERDQQHESQDDPRKCEQHFDDPLREQVESTAHVAGDDAP